MMSSDKTGLTWTNADRSVGLSVTDVLHVLFGSMSILLSEVNI